MKTPARWRYAMRIIIDVLWIGLGIAFVVYTNQLMQVTRFQTSLGLGVSMANIYLGVPILLSIVTVSLVSATNIPGLVPALVGHIRGSLGHTSVLSCTAMANISGSSAAEAAAVGSVIIPAMKEKGYRPGTVASVVAASETRGPIIPPSMTMIVYGSITGVSIGGLFIAGIIPGLLVACLLMLAIYFLSYLPQYEGLRATSKRSSWKQIVQATLKVWPALLAPVVIMGGILGGVFTATEAWFVACV